MSDRLGYPELWLPGTWPEALRGTRAGNTPVQRRRDLGNSWPSKMRAIFFLAPRGLRRARCRQGVKAPEPPGNGPPKQGRGATPLPPHYPLISSPDTGRRDQPATAPSADASPGAPLHLSAPAGRADGGARPEPPPPPARSPRPGPAARPGDSPKRGANRRPPPRPPPRPPRPPTSSRSHEPGTGARGAHAEPGARGALPALDPGTRPRERPGDGGTGSSRRGHGGGGTRDRDPGGLQHPFPACGPQEHGARAVPKREGRRGRTPEPPGRRPCRRPPPVSR